MDGKKKIRDQKKKKPARKAKEAVHNRNVEFTFYAPMAREVYLASEFNDWDTQTLPMKKSRGGIWKARIKLPPGRYEYKLFVDGCWVHEIPDAEIVPNCFGTYNCIICVE